MPDLPEEAVEAARYELPPSSKPYAKLAVSKAAPAIRKQAVEEERQRRIEAGREKVWVRDTDWVAEQPMEGWVTEDDYLNEVDAAVEERDDKLREALDRIARVSYDPGAVRVARAALEDDYA